MTRTGIFKRIAAPLVMGQGCAAGVYALPGSQVGWAFFAGFMGALGISIAMWPDD